MDPYYDQDIDYDPDIEHDPMPMRRIEPEIEIDPAQLAHYIDMLRSQQYLPYAVAGAAIGAGVGAAIWVGLTTFTSLQIRWMPVAIGLLAGFLARGAGKGIDRPFGLWAALMAVLGFVAGDLIAGCWLVALDAEEAGFLDILSAMTPGLAYQIVQDLYASVDLVFYGIGMGLAYWLALKKVKPQDSVDVEVPPSRRRDPEF